MPMKINACLEIKPSAIDLFVRPSLTFILFPSSDKSYYEIYLIISGIVYYGRGQSFYSD